MDTYNGPRVPAQTDFDVVVSGYGPTGLAAASLLSRRGHRVCVFERWPTLYGMPRMATIDGESARILQAACDIDHALRNSLPRTRYLLANDEGEVLLDHDWDKPHLCGFPFRISLHQPDIEDAMDARSRRQGVEVNQGWEVFSVAQTADAATVFARERTSGRERSVTAKYVIGADGARSAIRQALGIERESWPFRNAWLTFDARRKRRLPDFRGLSPDGRVAVIFCAPHGRAHSVIPLGVDHIRFNFEIDPDTPHDGKLDRSLAYGKLKEVYGVTEEQVEVYRQAIYPFEGKLAKRWRIGRVFLAGDAAHLMTPFLGQGGCSALRDAINLAWKLDLVLRSVTDEGLLDTYEAERMPDVRYYIDASDKLAALAFGDGKAEVPPPPPRALVGSVGPQGVVRYRGRQGRFDDVVGWGFQLVYRGEGAVQPLEPFGGVVAPIGGDIVDVDGTYERFFAEHAIQGLLMRPDFIIGGVARSAEDLPSLLELRQGILSRLRFPSRQ